MLIGDYPCTLDAKGRFLMPSALKKQFPDGEAMDFVLNKGLDNCLVLYPKKIWEAELTKIQSLNMYETKNRAFVRLFLNGSAPTPLDSSDRCLIPKYLSEKVGLQKEIILSAQIDRIEIWDKETYESWMDNSGYDMAKLADEVMSVINKQ
jgi:MraZ protein